MCAGGRIVNYLKALIEDQRTDILFVGYQAEGTAGVYTLSGYSAHADQATLLRFIKRMRIKPKEIRLVHGDQQAKLALQSKLQQAYPDIKVWIP